MALSTWELGVSWHVMAPPMTGLGENTLFVHGDWSATGTPVCVSLGTSPNHVPSWLQSAYDLCHLFSQKNGSHRGL